MPSKWIWREHREENMKPIVLASSSPRRRDLLQQIGIPFEVIPAHIDEYCRSHESARDFVQRMAQEKARGIWDILDPTERRCVLAADTVVVIDNQILGKPVDQADAIRMLRLLSRRTHQVLSAVAVYDGTLRTALSVNEVSFRAVSEAEMQAYWATGEPADKAGAYGIQGYAAIFIRHLVGSYTGVMGLPLFETATLLREAGINLWTCPAA